MTAAEDRLKRLDAGQFRELFVEELGWNKPDQKAFSVDVDGATYNLEPAASYKGVRVWVCRTLPPRRVQRLIDAEVRKNSNERLTIFTDGHLQEWRWPQSSDASGTSQARLVSHQHTVGRQNPALDQRLQLVTIDLSEAPTVVELLRRMRSAFDAESVTKRFYTKFLERHEGLVDALAGLADKRDKQWYSALLMNRLMFVYFMQRKGFMAGDLHYLRNRLAKVQGLLGEGHFYEFFADFLLPLFHEGLGSPAGTIDDDEIRDLVGDVPYINGGIFAMHPLEEVNSISVPDDVFSEIFDLFDAYQWHLDDRPTGNPNEINPDVLGYIFEQFINQKEKGAYYTKEDVSHFMTGSTLLPVFLQRLEDRTGINIWSHLMHDPDRYILDGLAFGVDEPLPDHVATEAELPRRPHWGEVANTPEDLRTASSPPSYPDLALPGETWWEVAHRRSTYSALVNACRSGDIGSVDAAVTANLDLESLAVDVIDRIDSPRDVVAAWEILSELKVIDPTCGSGAFLFAALKILQTLYGAVLDAAHAHARTSRNGPLRELLAAVDAHPNAEYFILKHTALSNLFGVDLMPEATEIARLRLFLKLVAAIDYRTDLEPLPDLDFNIKPGNALVGAFSVEDIRLQSQDLLSSDSVDAVIGEADRISSEYATYQSVQEANDYEAIRTQRALLLTLLDDVRNTVDQHFFKAQGYAGDFDAWRSSHQPFHWFIEFPAVMLAGGFDVVIGNPPYIGKSKIPYKFGGLRTADLPDIYAPCVERATQVTRRGGRLAMIVPISAQFGADFSALRDFLEARFSRLWVSTFSRNPAALFPPAVGVRSTIIVGGGDTDGDESLASLFTTKTHRWYNDYRPALFETLTYIERPQSLRDAGWIRPTSVDLTRILEKVMPAGGLLGSAVRPYSGGSVGFKQTSLYWISVFLDDPACYEYDGTPAVQTKIGRLQFGGQDEALLALAVLSSKFAFVWWYCTGDDFDVTQEGLKGTPIDPTVLPTAIKRSLLSAAAAIVKDFPNHVLFTKYAGKWMGNFVHAEMRDITDRVDLALAKAFDYVDLLPALEHAYVSVYKPTGDRPGTLHYDPFNP